MHHSTAGGFLKTLYSALAGVFHKLSKIWKMNFVEININYYSATFQLIIIIINERFGLFYHGGFVTSRVAMTTDLRKPPPFVFGTMVFFIESRFKVNVKRLFKKNFVEIKSVNTVQYLNVRTWSKRTNLCSYGVESRHGNQSSNPVQLLLKQIQHVLKNELYWQ